VPAGLAIADLEVAYGGDTALRDVRLTVPQGSTLAVIGPNGSGKSTLLKAIVGLLPTAHGSIDTGGATVALVLQSTDVDRSVPITVRDTVAMARYPARGLLRRFRAEDHACIDAAMARLDVDHLAHRQLHDLSGGQRQRVLVAQGVAQGADILLLDEPITGLDVVSREVILDVMVEERAAGRCVIMTTHSLGDARRCDQVLLLATRQIVAGPPDAVLREEHLRAAFGGRIVRVGDDFVLDDPHHVH